jgi:hypothetical protein
MGFLIKFQADLDDAYADMMKKKAKERTVCEKCWSYKVFSGSDGTYCKKCGHLKLWTLKQMKECDK